MNEMLEIFGEFSSIKLDEMDRVRLMNRREIKYTTGLLRNNHT